MRAESAKSYAENAGITDVESLAGMLIKSSMANKNEKLAAISPTSRLFLMQHMFEPISSASLSETARSCT